MSTTTLKVLLGIAITALVVLAYIVFQKMGSVEDIIDGANLKVDTAHYWKDKYNNEHATLQQSILSADAAKALHGKELDSIGKLLKVSAGNIKSVTTSTDVTSINIGAKKIDTVYLPADTAGGKPLRIARLIGTFQDPWLNFVATLGDTSSLKGYTIDSTSYVNYTKGFFNPKRYLDITHRSPYVRSHDVKSYAVDDAAGRLEVVLFSGAGYPMSGIDIKRPVGFIGLGIGYRLFSLGKKN